MFYSCILLLSILAVRSMPREFYPSLQPPVLFITARFPSATPEEVKTFITIPLEKALSSLRGLHSIRSLSRTGSVTLELEYHWGTDMLTAGFEARELIDNRYPLLPAKAEKPRVLSIDPNQKPLMELAVNSVSGDLAFLRRLTRRELKTALQMVPGVATVTLTGGTSREVAVTVDRDRALVRGLEGNTISSIIAAENTSLPAGTFEEKGIEYLVKSDNRLHSPEELGTVWVLPPEGIPFQIKDIASIAMQNSRQESFYLLNTEECIGLTIRSQEGSDPVELAKRIRIKVDELNQRYKGQLAMMVISDSSIEISDTISSLIIGLFIGACAAFIVIYILLGNWTYSLILISSIPCSLALSLISLHLLNVSLNTLSLGGLTLGTGMLVDNSVVVLEHLAGTAAWRERETVFIRTAEMARSIGASTATSIIVFAPLFFLPGLIGALYKDLALAVTTAIAASFFVSVTLTPVLFHLFPAPPAGSTMGRIIWWYGTMLYKCMHRKWIPLLVLISMLLIAGFSFALLPKRFFPVLPAREVWVDMNFEPGMPLETLKKTGLEVTAAIHSLPGIKYITGQAGKETQDQLYTVNPEDVETKISLRAGLEKGYDFPAAYRAVMAVISNFGISADLAPPNDTLASLLNVSRRNGFLISSSDTGTLESNTAAVLSYLNSQNISAAVYPSVLQEEIQVLPRREQLVKTGVSVEKLGDTLSFCLQGSDAGYMWIEGEEYPVRVLFGKKGDYSFHDLQGLPISPSQSGITRLGSVSEIRKIITTAAIFRNEKKDTNRIRLFENTGNIQGAEDLTSIFPGFVSQEISLLQKEASEIIFIFIAALLLLYLILSAQFESFIEPLLILITIPLSAAGSGLVLLCTAGSFNVQSALALLVLFGLAVNNAIILRDRMIGTATPVIICAQERLRPVSISAFTTIAALIPTAGSFFGPTPQGELAVAVIGGLSLSTFTTLLLIPLFSLRGRQGT